MKRVKIKFKNQKGNTGFTLVEALVAISILMIAIASPMTLAQKGLSTATLSKDQMVASFLAQDALEAARNIRDEIATRNNTGDWLSGNGSGLSLSNCTCTGSSCDFDSGTPTYCTIDTTAPDWASAVQPSSANLGPLKMSYSTDVNGIKHFLKYDYLGTDISKFTRYINIKRSISNANEAVVSVRVFWSSPQGIQKIDVQDFIYNYSENL